MKKFLSNEVYNRLCNCCTQKRDLQELVNAKWAAYKEAGKDHKGFTKEDALIAVLELLDENGFDYGLSGDEYTDLIYG